MPQPNKIIEFVLTYSWLILVIFAVVAIMVNFNVIDIRTNSCTLTKEIKCTDFSRSEGKLILVIQNNLDDILLGIDIEVEDCEQKIKGKTINKNSKETFVLGSCKQADEFKSKINFSYIDTDGNKNQIEGQIIKRSSIFRITV